MSDPLPPPPPQPASPRAAFLERAAPIIAQERGLTPRARLLLQSLAADMELSADDFDAVLERLQSGELMAANAVDPERARYREFLKGQLAELKSGILSARHEQTLVTFAVGQLGLAEEAARDDLRAVAAEMGLRRVPLEEALRYVEELAAQKIGDDNLVDRNDVLRLYHLARDWGLEPADVDELVRYRLEENSARQKRDKLWNVGILTGAGVAATLVVVILLVLGFRSLFGTGETPPEVVDGGSEEPIVAPPRSKPPTWWDTDLTIAISQAKNDREDFAPVYAALVADEPGRRAQGYELLIDHAAAHPFDYRNWKPLEPILSGCYALEPDDSAADRLRSAWLKVSQRAIDEVPSTADGYQAAIRPINSAVKGIKDKRTPVARGQQLADELGSMLRAPIDASLSESDLQKQALAALSMVLLEELPDAIPKRPEVLSRHYSVLAALARDRATPEELAKIDAVIAATAIEFAADTWRNWDAILQRGIESRDTLAVLRIVDAFDRCKNRDLKKVLGDRLFARVGVSSAGLPITQYAATLRKALGASAPADTSDRSRWLRLESRAATTLENRPTNDVVAQLRSTAELAWHANLAMSLALPRPNPGQFDLWIEEGPPWDKKTEEPEETAPGSDPLIPLTSERLSREQQETFDRYVHDLGDWQKVDEARRASYLRGISQVATKLGDVTPIQARAIASYMLGRKSDEEQQTIVESAATLKWKQLRIALADGIERSQLAPEHLRRIVIAFSGQEILEIDRNRAAARQALLRSVAMELGAPRSGERNGERASDIDRWAGQLAAVYRERARLLGVPPSEVENGATAAGLLRMSAARLEPSRGSKTSSDISARLIDSSDALGETDAQRTVLLQRALIARSFEDLVRRKPDQRAAGAKLVDDYQRSSAAAKNVLAQLRDGEAALLELWMLWK